MSNAMPKFNFSQSTIKTEEELDAMLASEGGGKQKDDKFFKPGTYQLKIASVIYQGAANDDRWGKFLLSLQGVNGKAINYQVLVPLQGPVFTSASGKNTGYPFKKFQGFMAGLGITLSVKNLESSVVDLFSDPTKTLVGRSISVNIGYDGNHIGYVGKDSNGGKIYQVNMRDGSILKDAVTGKAISFSEYQAAVDYLKTTTIEVERYTNVLSLNPGEAVVGSTNW